MDIKTIFSTLTVSAAALCFADPTITIDRVQQRYPWNGLVDIDYTVAGIEGDANDYQVSFAWSSESAGQDGEVVLFDDVASCDLPTAVGTHRVTWNAAADGLAFLAKDLELAATLDYAPVTEAEADYLIVDISAGSNATDYPVRLVKTGAGYSTDNFNRHVYKQTKIVLKKVHAGEFWMGDSKTSWNSLHRVLLTKDYWLGIFEATQGQIKGVTGQTGASYKADGGGELAAERPEDRISYDVTMNPTEGLIGRLNLRAKRGGAAFAGFGLPSEAEWEYVCRAGTTTKYPWGDSADAKNDYSWNKDNSNSQTHPVGLKLPNAWGFYDMIGNVSEWCRDWAYHYPAYSETYVSTNPVGTVWMRVKVCRGSSYHPGLLLSSCADREMGQTYPNQTGGGYNPSYSTQFGFRLYKEMGVAGESVAGVTKATATKTGVKVDLTTNPVKTLSTTADILPVAWNGDADWVAGGAGKTTSVTITSASGADADDPATWVDAETVTLVDGAAGEGLATWTPTAQAFYRFDLKQGGATAATAYFNLKNCPELTGKQSIEDEGFTAALSQVDYPCDGYPHTPSVTVTDKNGNSLTPDVDYVVTYSQNLNAGTATVTISGAGDYEGIITKTFTITRIAPTDKATGSFSGTAAIDTRIADELPLLVKTWRELPPLVWNDTADWLRDGDTNGLNMVRVTLDPLDGQGTPTGETILVLDEANGEGAAGWSHVKSGSYLAVSALYKKSNASAVNWTNAGTNAVRRIDIIPPKCLIILFR